MKVLAISGSPRRDGNTDDALKAIIEELEGRIPGLENEFLQITDYHLEHCRGCRHCMTHVECALSTGGGLQVSSRTSLIVPTAFIQTIGTFMERK
jgi:multimeric flavodoxin WrbA